MEPLVHHINHLAIHLPNLPKYNQQYLILPLQLCLHHYQTKQLQYLIRIQVILSEDPGSTCCTSSGHISYTLLGMVEFVVVLISFM